MDTRDLAGAGRWATMPACAATRSGAMASRLRLDRFAAVAALLAGLAGVPSGALAQSPPAAEPGGACPGGAAPNIAVVAEVADFRYFEQLSIAELTRLGHGDAVTADHTGGKVLGLSRQGATLVLNTTRPRIEAAADGSLCVGLSDGALVYRLSTEIYLASNLAPQGCLYGQVRAHEERHAKVGQRLFTEFATAAQKAIADALAKAPFVPLTDEHLAATVAGARLRQIIDPIYQDFLQTYRKRQAIIDTSGEFARVAEACPGEQDRILGN